MSRSDTWRRLGGTIVAGAVSSVAIVIAGASPAAAAPLSARSYYVNSLDLTWAYNRGCGAGEADEAQAGTQERVVVLDFGAMYKDSAGGWNFTFFGGADHSAAKARDMVEEWARGFKNCTGTDNTSVAYIGIGTNNSGGDVTTGAGAKMAELAKTAIDHVSALGVYSQGRPVGANDFEDWDKGAGLNSDSRDWIAGYNGVTGRPIMVNYGAASGCPTSSVPTASSCNTGHNAESIWRVSWSGAAYPLPEIYATSGSNAKQWRYLSKYSINEKSAGKFEFIGVMSQAGACSQYPPCTGTDNSPDEAWNQLEQQLDLDSAVTMTPGNPTNIWWQ